ncbi:MAG TPA: hypothetical protein VJK52_04275 [Candidatus Nanoarchaeia archaeon]|nr:hypothetical protein [Candidatus Nanoarchaeia archaeon]
MTTALNLMEVLQDRNMTTEELAAKILAQRKKSGFVDDDELEQLQISENLAGMLAGSDSSETFEEEIQRALSEEEETSILPAVGSKPERGSTATPPPRGEDIRQLRCAALNRAVRSSDKNSLTIANGVYPDDKRNAYAFGGRLKALLAGKSTLTDPFCERLAPVLNVSVETLKVREMTPEEQGKYNKFLGRRPRAKKEPSTSTEAKTRRPRGRNPRGATEEPAASVPTAQRSVSRTSVQLDLSPARLQEVIQNRTFILAPGKEQGTMLLSYVLTTEEVVRLIQ